MRLGILLLGLIAVTSCREHPKEKPSERILWKPIASWTGHGNLQTDSFEMVASGWRIRWEAKNPKDPKAGRFRVDVHSAISGRPLSTAVDHAGSGRDIDYVEEDPRVFFLVVDAKDMDWSITVEEPLIEDIGAEGSPRG